jgi:lipopolysaccharide export system permease protein
MQFFWKYIDDFMGKGLGVSVILEVLFYISASLIPLALPLAMLLSSIMTFGNLAENNELTALKASGLSLYRIMRPLTIVVLLIAMATFYFANYVIPVANLKWHSLIFDIQETKVAALLTPGSYSKELEGYAIKVEKGTEDSFSGITIHDYTDPAIIKTVKAESGSIFKSADGKYLFFRLVNGKIFEELQTGPPIFQADGRVLHSGGSFRPSTRTEFAYLTYKMDLTGFQLNRSDQNMFKDEFEMLNVFQISEAKDSMQRQADLTQANFTLSIKNHHPYFQSRLYEGNPKQVNAQGVQSSNVPEAPVALQSLRQAERIAAMNNAIVKLRRKSQDLDGQLTFLHSLEENSGKFSIEFHKKISLTATIIVLFFIGAPLGAIVRKGGFGAPVVIAALLFMIYFVLSSLGESLAQSQKLSPFLGMWMPTLILSPVAALLMTSAANDLGVFDRKLWRLILSFGRRR